jgi:hypothetical protein
MKFHAESITIQCLWRQRHARKATAAKRLERQRSNEASVKIQCLCRQRQARQATAAKRIARQRFSQAAVKIQCLFRQRQAIKATSAKRLQRQRFNKAAVKIQCLFRQRQAIKTTSVERLEKKIRDTENYEWGEFYDECMKLTEHMSPEDSFNYQLDFLVKEVAIFCYQFVTTYNCT